MDLNKRKYKKQEVSAIINAYKGQYEKLIAEYRARIGELLKENAMLAEKVEASSKKEPLLLAMLERAEKTSLETVEKSELQYSLEMERLKSFVAKWDDYFKNLEEKYPLYPTTKIAIDLKNKVEGFSENDRAKQAIEEIDGILDEQAEFNPKQKIKDYVVATSDNGFNLDEVLNPGKLELEDLCKELGLIEEE